MTEGPHHSNIPIVVAVAEALAGIDDDPTEWHIVPARVLYEAGLLNNDFKGRIVETPWGQGVKGMNVD